MHYSYLPIFKVYLINLKRREDRRDRMQRSLEVLGIDVTLTDAVDGKYDIITHTFTSVTQCQSSTCLHLSCSMQSLFHYYTTVKYDSLFLLSPRALNSSQLRALGIEMLPGYKDPYSDRVLTKGEIGCFLSHYNIWKKVHSKTCSTISCYINKLLMVLNANSILIVPWRTLHPWKLCIAQKVL